MHYSQKVATTAEWQKNCHYCNLQQKLPLVQFPQKNDIIKIPKKHHFQPSRISLTTPIKKIWRRFWIFLKYALVSRRFFFISSAAGKKKVQRSL